MRRFISKALSAYRCPVFDQMVEVYPFTFHIYS